MFMGTTLIYLYDEILVMMTPPPSQKINNKKLYIKPQETNYNSR